MGQFLRTTKQLEARQTNKVVLLRGHIIGKNRTSVPAR